MGTEIERKYLIRDDRWRAGATGTAIRQGYLSTVRGRVVRVRTAGDAAYLTIKGPSRGAARPEFEYPIPRDDAEQLLALCEQPLIEKTRYRIPHAGLVWEVDEFHGVNRGLLLAECELADEDQAIALPPWVGDEVTHDPRYHNSNLVAHPFRDWER